MRLPSPWVTVQSRTSALERRLAAHVLSLAWRDLDWSLDRVAGIASQVPGSAGDVHSILDARQFPDHWLVWKTVYAFRQRRTEAGRPSRAEYGCLRLNLIAINHSETMLSFPPDFIATNDAINRDVCAELVSLFPAAAT